MNSLSSRLSKFTRVAPTAARVPRVAQPALFTRGFADDKTAVQKTDRKQRRDASVLSPFSSFFADDWPFNDRAMQRMFFDDFFPRVPVAKELNEWRPRADIQETKDNYQIHAELPGVSKENLKVTVNENVLTLQGERKSEVDEQDKDKKVHRRERMYGSFMRTFVLPEEIDPNQIKANFKDGVLQISVPKTQKPEKQPIEVKIDQEQEQTQQ